VSSESSRSARSNRERASKPSVRPAVRTHLDQILRIDSSADVAKSRRTLIETAIDRGECLVALKNDIPVGYAIMNHGFFDRGFVSLVYVDPAHRRRKAGTNLFDECERRCKSVRIFTSANLSNLSIQGFLLSRGYVLSGTVQHLDEGDPELFYSKKLR
jgi:ribosomal protein S18 acetylase RimI-like enzyme